MVKIGEIKEQTKILFMFSFQCKTSSENRSLIEVVLFAAFLQMKGKDDIPFSKKTK